MEVSNVAETVVRPTKNKKRETEKLPFENKWQKSISGDELVRRVHKHIDELYAARNKK